MNSRAFFSLIVLFCFSLIGVALYQQYVVGLEPCPLCILQRVAFILTGFIALIGVIMGNVSRSRWFPVVVTLPVLLGLATAARHLYLEWVPSARPQECGADDLNFILKHVPFEKWLSVIFRGSADCGVVVWRFLELSIAAWSFICFLILLLGLIYWQYCVWREWFTHSKQVIKLS